MTIDDPGWGGFIEEGAPEVAGQTTAGPPATEQRTGDQPTTGWQAPSSPGPPGVGPGKRRRVPRLAFIAAAVVVIGGGVGAAVAVSSSKSQPTTTTQPSVTTQPRTTQPPGSSTSATGGTGTEPSLLSVVPRALIGTCTRASTAKVAGVEFIDAIACATTSVSGSSADLIGYVRFKGTADMDSYFSHLLALNQLSTFQGNCSSVTLSASNSAGEYCQGTYTDAAGTTGSELIFVGSDFNAGGTSGSAAAGCSSAFPGSSGVTVLVWTSPRDHSGGFGVDCTSSTTSFAQGMQSNLVHGNYELND